jgi:hypothetical protein
MKGNSMQPVTHKTQTEKQKTTTGWTNDQKEGERKRGKEKEGKLPGKRGGTKGREIWREHAGP